MTEDEVEARRHRVLTRMLLNVGDQIYLRINQAQRGKKKNLLVVPHWYKVTKNMGDAICVSPVNWAQPNDFRLKLHWSPFISWENNTLQGNKLIYYMGEDRRHRRGLFQLTLAVYGRQSKWGQSLHALNLNNLWALIISFLLTKRTQVKLRFSPVRKPELSWWSTTQ